MKISSAYGAGTNTNQNLTDRWPGSWQLYLPQRLPGFFKKHCAHGRNVCRSALFLKPSHRTELLDLETRLGISASGILKGLRLVYVNIFQRLGDRLFLGLLE